MKDGPKRREAKSEEAAKGTKENGAAGKTPGQRNEQRRRRSSSEHSRTQRSNNGEDGAAVTIPGHRDRKMEKTEQQ